MANLVIVESPSKANTIKGYLGSNYKVIASVGHIRDLPKSTLGIDIENNFEPHYINIRGKGDIINELKREAKNASKIFLATDPDREGEAISWHIASQLGIPKNKACRVTFTEITKNAVKEAIKNPRVINEDLVNSQQARRILDRIVGFSLSQLLWKSVKSGLSGGRVQSVATRIITEREREIRNFSPSEYWTIRVGLLTDEKESFDVKLYGTEKGKLKIKTKEEADRIEKLIKEGSFNISSVSHAKKHKAPPAPFKTSTLQQEAFNKLGFGTQKIMKIAQELYEGLNVGAEYGGVQGLITYMRTDSVRVSSVATDAAREYIIDNFGQDYIPDAPHQYRDSVNMQDAHEAIRPANVSLEPKLVKKMLSADQYKLYKLIWERFIASQMESAVYDTVSVNVENSGYIFKASGEFLKSKGYLAVYDNTQEAEENPDSDEVHLNGLPNIKKSTPVAIDKVEKQQHFTKPPARYTEATLIDFFVENGIARPSTYATIISIIVSREYVKRDGKYLVATPLGEVITDFMKEHFPEIVDYEFTASLETKLDSIENRENTVVGVISEFYKDFERELANATNSKVEFSPAVEQSDVVCEKCGAKMIYKNGRYGRFLACPNYPECKNTKAVDKDGNVAQADNKEDTLAGMKCEKCGAEMIVRTGKYGTFYACSNYPECRFTKQKTEDTGVECPKCSSKILVRHGKGGSLFYSCDKYPECDFSSWDMPLNEKCPACNEMLYYKKSRKAVICKNPGCDYSRDEEMAVIK